MCIRDRPRSDSGRILKAQRDRPHLRKGQSQGSGENPVRDQCGSPAQCTRLLRQHAAASDRALSEMDTVTRVEGAGSLRRRRSTVHDIDLAASTEDPEATAEGFSKLREIALISERGRAKVVGRTQSGINVDLRLSAPASFGNMLQHLTGSAEHNVALRGYARSLGMSISEYALSEEEGRNEEEGGRQYSYPTEEEVYEHLGMPCIPPELREGQGELEAAREGRLQLTLPFPQFRRYTGHSQVFVHFLLRGVGVLPPPLFFCLLYTSPSPRDRTRSR